MTIDFCFYVRTRIGTALSELGLTECDCRRFGDELRGRGEMFAADVAYYQGGGLCLAISHSDGDGTSCFVGRPGDDPTTYQEWPSLWEMIGMSSDFLAHEAQSRDPDAKLKALDAYLIQFPGGRDAMIDLIATKIAELMRA